MLWFAATVSKPPEWGPLPAAGRETRVDERPLQRGQCCIHHRGIRLRRRGGWHLPLLKPLEDLDPGRERLVVAEIVVEVDEVQRRDRAYAVTPDAGLPHQRFDASSNDWAAAGETAASEHKSAAHGPSVRVTACFRGEFDM